MESETPIEKIRTRITLNRLAMAILAIAIGLAGQSLFRQHSLWDGILLHLLAIAIFLRAANAPEISTPHIPTMPKITPHRQKLIGGWMLVLAATLSFIGVILFNNSATLSTAWQFYDASLIALIVGAIVLSPAQHALSHLKITRRHLPLITILLLAVILRLWNFNHLPFGVWYDEAEAGLQARQWLALQNYKPAFYEPINISGQLLILYSATLRWLTDSALALRFVSVLFGVGGVGAAYLFGRELHGKTFGLMLAFLMAVMRWDINFSRIAMTGIDTPFFEFLTLFYLTRWIKHRSLRSAAFAGLALGFGLSFYTAFRLFVLAVGIFAIFGAMLWQSWRHAQKSTRQQWLWTAAGAGMLILSTWLAVMPVAQYALRHPSSYWARVNTTSILTRRDDPNLGRALIKSTAEHLEMFNFTGDNNGRHNLPGEPELDPLMGLLFILGIALALKNIRQPQNLFFLFLFPIALTGGIFSLDFEAPQSLRSIAVLPAVAYFAALPALWFVKESQRVLFGIPKKWQLLPVGIAALYLLGFNTHTYFVRQANDFAVWNSFSTPESLAGKKMAELGADVDYFLSPFLANHPTIEFLAPNAPHVNIFNLPDALPIRTDATRPAALFIHFDDAEIFSAAQNLYPQAKFERVSNQPENPASIYTVELSPADIASVQGLQLNLWTDGTSPDAQPPAQSFRAKSIAPSGFPAPHIAVWEGTLYAPTYGSYRFYLDAPGSANLYLDGYEILNGTGEIAGLWTLAQGNHHFKLQANIPTENSAIALKWEPPGENLAEIPTWNFYTAPVSTRGLLGEYFPNDSWNGTPALARIDPMLDIYFHFTPLPRPYTARWTGSLNVPSAGIYRLALSTVGVARLTVDGETLIKSETPNLPFEQVLSLTQGLHPITIEFLDNADRSQIHLLWMPPDAENLRPVPAENLIPPFGDDWQPAKIAPIAAAFDAQSLSLTPIATLSEGLREPRDVAVGTDGKIFVVDTGIVGVHVFSATGKTIGAWTETGEGAFKEPLAIVADTESVWVLDSERQWLYQFSPADGSPLGKIGGIGTNLYHPRGLTAVTGDNGDTLFAIANTGSGNIVFLNREGTQVASLGNFGDTPGELNEPVDLLQDTFGAFYVTEGANAGRWQWLNANGNPLGIWRTDAPVALDGTHLAWVGDGSIFATNSQAETLRRYAPDGTLLDEWHTIGDVTFQKPVGIFVDADTARLFVTDVGTGKVYVFKIAF